MDLGKGGKRSFWQGSSELIGFQPAFPLANDDFLIGLTGAHFGIWQLDLTTLFLELNPVAARLLGLGSTCLAPGEYVPFPEDERRRLESRMRDSIANGTQLSEEFQTVLPGGETRWLYVLGQGVLSGDGECRFFGGILADISNKKAAERDLQDRERQLSTIVSNLPGIAYRCALVPEKTISFVSEGVERLTGYTAAQVISGQQDWHRMIHPEDRRRVWAHIAQAVSVGRTYEVEYRIVRASGEARWVHDRGSPSFSEAGKACFLDGFVRDIHDQVIAEQRRREVEERYRLASQSAHDMIWDMDLVTGEIEFNDAMGIFLGTADGRDPGRDFWVDAIHPDDREQVCDEIADALMGSATGHYACEHRFRRADGEYADVVATGRVIRSEKGEPIRLIGSLKDVSAAKRAEVALRESEAINRGIVEASTDCIKLLDLSGCVLFMNDAGARAHDIADPSSIYGRHLVALWPDSAKRHIQRALAAARKGRVGRYSGPRSTAGGATTWWDIVVSPVLGDDGKPITLVAIARDITERREAEERLLWGATHDALTNLPNRTFFQRKLNDAVAEARRSGQQMGLLLLDLDNFKQVNDSLGHDAGDVLLKTFAERLGAACVEATPARLGGDEFALVITDVSGSAALLERAAELQKLLAEPFVHAGRILDCHATIGAALYPLHGRTPEELLKNADIALYAAKASHRGRAVTFDPEHRAELQQRSSMINLARGAVQEGRILPYYQPKVHLGDRSIYGFEALLRWRHFDRGMQLPATITAAFEDLELAAAISDQIIDQVIVDMREWLDRDVPFGHVAVNAAAAEFRRDNFAESVLERLERAGIPTRHFHLEVTETVFLGRGAEYVDRALKMLSGAGVSIALDDFGTGYASLRHLKQFPVDIIKIDQSFVRDMETDPEDEAIIEAVLNLGQSLKIGVVAEGIETEQQAARLMALGCQFGQGFLFSQAVSAGEAAALVMRPTIIPLRRRA